MKIKYNKKFNNHFVKLPQKIKIKANQATKIFIENPFDPRLKNHALHGRMNEWRSFSVTGDVRIIFKEYDNYVIVLFLDIGSHPKVYK